jgi:hypothetical protein
VRILDLKTPVEQPPSPSATDLPVSAAGLAPLVPPRIATPATQGNTSAAAGSPVAATLKKPDAKPQPASPESPNDAGDDR